MSIGPAKAAAQAEQAADDAVRGAGLAIDAARQAKTDAAAIKELLPDPQGRSSAELAARRPAPSSTSGRSGTGGATCERSTSNWPSSSSAREQLAREIGEKMADTNNEPHGSRRRSTPGSWAARRAHRPTSGLPQLDEEIAGLEAETGALGIAYERLLAERAAARREEPAARCSPTSASRWTPRRPSTGRSSTSWRRSAASCSSCGRPGVDGDLPAPDADERADDRRLGAARRSGCRSRTFRACSPVSSRASVFDLLRADAGFCESVATVEQAALEQGVSVSRLRRSDASWLGDGRQDLVGPQFDAAWGKSPEEQEQAERIAAYQEHQRRVVWGEE